MIDVLFGKIITLAQYMKVLLINGSPHQQGNTAIALDEMARRFNANGIDTEIIWIGTKAVQGCIGCYKCMELNRCAFQDELYNSVRAALESSDALVVGTPTYYAGPNGSLCALLDRVFCSSGNLLRGKPAAAVAVCRRGGAVTAFERINKYFEMMNMPMANSQYWNIVYGRKIGDAAADAEGLQTMRTLADNMTWLLKSLDRNQRPEQEPWTMTNYIRRDLKQ